MSLLFFCHTNKWVEPNWTFCNNVQFGILASTQCYFDTCHPLNHFSRPITISTCQHHSPIVVYPLSRKPICPANLLVCSANIKFPLSTWCEMMGPARSNRDNHRDFSQKINKPLRLCWCHPFTISDYIYPEGVMLEVFWPHSGSHIKCKGMDVMTPTNAFQRENWKKVSGRFRIDITLCKLGGHKSDLES